METFRPTAGCLQYHRGLLGRITTFNFADESTHLAVQDYSICLKRFPGKFCALVLIFIITVRDDWNINKIQYLYIRLLLSWIQSMWRWSQFFFDCGRHGFHGWRGLWWRPYCYRRYICNSTFSLIEENLVHISFI